MLLPCHPHAPELEEICTAQTEGERRKTSARREALRRRDVRYMYSLHVGPNVRIQVLCCDPKISRDFCGSFLRKGGVLANVWRSQNLKDLKNPQGHTVCIVHKQPPPPLGPPEPRHGSPVGSYGVAVSYQRGSPVKGNLAHKEAHTPRTRHCTSTVQGYLACKKSFTYETRRGGGVSF